MIHNTFFYWRSTLPCLHLWLQGLASAWKRVAGLGMFVNEQKKWTKEYVLSLFLHTSLFIQQNDLIGRQKSLIHSNYSVSDGSSVIAPSTIPLLTALLRTWCGCRGKGATWEEGLGPLPRGVPCSIQEIQPICTSNRINWAFKSIWFGFSGG